MDKHNEGGVNMAKVMLYVFCSLLSYHAFGKITNLMEIMGQVVTPSVISEIPRRDFSTPETAYLNFIRALATTNEADWVAGFAPQKVVEYVGTADPDWLTGRSDSPLVEIFSNHMVSNIVITSHTVSNISVGVQKVSADVACFIEGSIQTNTFPIVFSKINGTWVITRFLDDE